MERAEYTTDVPPPPMAVSGRVLRPRHLQVAGFLAATAWYFCATALASSAANGLGFRIGLGPWQPVLEGVFDVFLVAVGVLVLAGIERRKTPLRLMLGLPLRTTARTEWAEGAALGWGIAAISVLLMLPAGMPSVQLWTAWRGWEMALLNVVALGLMTLAFAIGLFGYGFQRLIEGTGPARATVLLCLGGGLYAMSGALGQPVTGGRVLMGVLVMLLLASSWVRTHGLWMLWGMAFAWTAAVGVLFGLPVAGSTNFSAVIDMRARGPEWLTGGSFGPAEALPMLVLLLMALPVLVKMTSEYAWDYTRAPIIPAGYAVDVPPPAAHGEMERSTAKAVPVLVQIVPMPQGGTGVESGRE